MILDGTLIETDRLAGVRDNGNDRWFSQKDKMFGGAAATRRGASAGGASQRARSSSSRERSWSGDRVTARSSYDEISNAASVEDIKSCPHSLTGRRFMHGSSPVGSLGEMLGRLAEYAPPAGGVVALRLQRAQEWREHPPPVRRVREQGLHGEAGRPGQGAGRPGAGHRCGLRPGGDEGVTVRHRRCPPGRPAPPPDGGKHPRPAGP
ncbi:predicted protein [Streptomyces viridosporus ATCC 14672]|uniref:Predicted protein n=1 Tax=Streptomyces viridosporus (strain ATCC 14672 / DSM 40746 / JCM 4963 / KCTC 9882 / NRRL B-12104 / FH 1290) TaxID=566461 RepID=D6A701_STRV1|nr:predicted protein [Streptomyces viridosporus ATCC 14672]